jgi:catechol 2,3-dioxygenase-like lactoylglutathione lyase family enzyme
MANRAGAILAVSDFERSVAFYRDAIGFEVEALYGDPPYATLMLAGARLSLAEQGHPAEDRPGVTLEAPRDRTRQNVVLVVEVDDARAEHERLGGLGIEFLADPYEPPPSFRPGVTGFAGEASSPGGCFFCVDPDS